MPHTESTEDTEFFRTQRRAGARGESTEQSRVDGGEEGSERKRKKSALQMLILHGAGLQILLNGVVRVVRVVGIVRAAEGAGIIKPHTESTEDTEFFRTQRRAGARGESAERGGREEEDTEESPDGDRESTEGA